MGESKEEKKTMTGMKVKFLTADPSSNKLLVVPMDLETRKALPIWIGPFQAKAIAPRLKRTSVNRPLTHDLIRNMIQALNYQISRFVISDLYIKAEKRELAIDSRPSDPTAKGA